jgi:hypothetical protein
MKPKVPLCLALVLSGAFFNFPIIARGADESSALKVMIDLGAAYAVQENGFFAMIRPCSFSHYHK